MRKGGTNREMITRLYRQHQQLAESYLQINTGLQEMLAQLNNIEVALKQVREDIEDLQGEDRKIKRRVRKNTKELEKEKEEK